MIMVLLLSGTIYAILFCGSSQLVSIFNSGKNETPQALAVAGLRLYFLACPFIGFNIVTATYFTSTECPLPTQVISFLRGFFSGTNGLFTLYNPEYGRYMVRLPVDGMYRYRGRD